jgi:hypothetical protein
MENIMGHIMGHIMENHGKYWNYRWNIMEHLKNKKIKNEASGYICYQGWIGISSLPTTPSIRLRPFH